MVPFDPPIENRPTEELVRIKYGTTSVWQQEAINQAEWALRQRGVTPAQEKHMLAAWEEELAIKDGRYKRWLERNRRESYSPIEMCLIWITAPLILLGQFHFDLSLFELRQDQYKRKFRQRLFLLIGGLISWVIFFRIIYD